MCERIIDKMIACLKSEINYLQAEALSASAASDEERCRKTLSLQTNAIDCLIRVVDAKCRILMQR